MRPLAPRPLSKHTGVAAITVTDDGENTIIVVPGANHELRPECVGGWSAENPVRVLLCQNEIPIDTTIAALEKYGVGCYR